MSSARPDTWMPIYWGDYAKATAHLSAAQHGAYLMLLKHYWSIGGPLPEDDGALWRIACADSPAHWRRLKPTVLAFFHAEAGVLRHARVERELEKARAYIEAQSLRGQKGGRPPKTNQTKPTAFAGDTPGETTSPSPASSRIESVSSAPAAPETGRKANAISVDFKPDEGDLAWLKAARPDIGAALLDSRMEDFHLWLGSNRPMSFNASASWRSFMKRTHAAAAPRGASTAPSPLPPPTEWEPRLKDYRPGRFWSPMWGPRPESGQCHAPASDLAKWRAEHGP